MSLNNTPAFFLSFLNLSAASLYDLGKKEGNIPYLILLVVGSSLTLDSSLA